MKKVKNFLEKNPLLRLLISTLFISVGVYLSFPEKGLVATLPLHFLFFLVSSFLYFDWRFALAVPPFVAFLFGKAALLPDPFLYAFFAFLAAVCAFLTVLFVRRAKKKKILLSFAALFLIAGILTPMVYMGSPFHWKASYEKARGYLSEHYPDQEFYEVKMHYDLRNKSYRTLVLYEYETGLLTSTVSFGQEKVEDGFFDDFTHFMTEKKKTELIRSFQKISASVITESIGVISKAEITELKGSYGNIDESVVPYMHYSVTLREEKPQRKDFAEECARLLAALQENEVRFGKITFYGLDAGRVVHRLEVTFDTPANPETLLANVVNA